MREQKLSSDFCGLNVYPSTKATLYWYIGILVYWYQHAVPLILLGMCDDDLPIDVSGSHGWG